MYQSEEMKIRDIARRGAIIKRRNLQMRVTRRIREMKQTDMGIKFLLLHFISRSKNAT